MANKRKRFSNIYAWAKRLWEQESGFNGADSWPASSPVYSRHLTPHHFESGTWQPCTSPVRESEP
jgi:hypothetical protein